SPIPLTLEERARFVRRQVDADRELDIWEITTDVCQRAFADLAPLSDEQRREFWTLSSIASRNPAAELLARYPTGTIAAASAQQVLKLLHEVEAERNDLFAHPSDDVRKHLAAALGGRKDAGTFPGLVRLLKDRSRDVQMEAADQLGLLGDARAVEPLLEEFEKTPERRLRGTILWALGKLGYPTEALKLRQA
ncbi:MAG: HEAT repeat domain-containing protein, partial [Candidatus Dormibacteraeota bacterium]|nr:HEAT repeat domain-containing protein [Candidatus Dormibacteraeota bacterium]